MLFDQLNIFILDKIQLGKMAKIQQGICTGNVLILRRNSFVIALFGPVHEIIFIFSKQAFNESLDFCNRS